jgi:hypothetical protein
MLSFIDPAIVLSMFMLSFIDPAIVLSASTQKDHILSQK